MTKRLESLINDAKMAGYQVKWIGSRLEIFKRDRRSSSRILRGLVRFDDGTALDMTVRFDLARGLRSYADMREVLRLPAEATQ